MNPQLTDRILLVTAATGLLLVGLAYAIWGGAAALGAAAGAGVAVLNWTIMRFLSRGMAAGKVTRGQFLAMTGMKTAGVMTLCWIAITRWGLSFDGFTVGIGALVLGVLVGPKLMGPVENAPHDAQPEES